MSKITELLLYDLFGQTEDGLQKEVRWDDRNTGQQCIALALSHIGDEICGILESRKADTRTVVCCPDRLCSGRLLEIRCRDGFRGEVRCPVCRYLIVRLGEET